MKRAKAKVFAKKFELAVLEGPPGSGKIVLYTLMRRIHATRWDLFTFNFWNGYDYLFCFKNPKMIPMALPWFKLAISQFIHGPSERITMNKRS